MRAGERKKLEMSSFHRLYKTRPRWRSRRGNGGALDSGAVELQTHESNSSPSGTKLTSVRARTRESMRTPRRNSCPWALSYQEKDQTTSRFLSEEWFFFLLSAAAAAALSRGCSKREKAVEDENRRKESWSSAGLPAARHAPLPSDNMHWVSCVRGKGACVHCLLGAKRSSVHLSNTSAFLDDGCAILRKSHAFLACTRLCECVCFFY